jgi:hypothetical protein
MSVALGSNLYCAGFIQNAPFNTEMEIVGGDEEAETRHYERGDYVYISGGSSKGVKVGDMYSIIRPKGKAHSSFSSKGDLGTYIQELGYAEVIDVRTDVSVARIKMNCESVLLGDLLLPHVKRSSPKARQEIVLDRFAEANGKKTGRIVLARDGQEFVTRDQIVFIDLGAEDNVQVGDYLTVFRPLGKGNVTKYANDEFGNPKDKGFGSERYQGGEYSVVTPRKSGDKGDGGIVTSTNAKSRRPDNLRKVVGEVIILNVRERTATAVITRVIQEIHTGDHVEMQ